MRHARADLALARSEIGEEDLPELHCYHAQQAVEKSLKAVLLAHGIPFDRTHVIQTLIDRVPTGSAVPPEVYASTILTLHASQTRYPGTEEEVTEDEWREAVRLATAVVEWADRLVSAF